MIRILRIFSYLHDEPIALTEWLSWERRELILWMHNGRWACMWLVWQMKWHTGCLRVLSQVTVSHIDFWLNLSCGGNNKMHSGAARPQIMRHLIRTDKVVCSVTYLHMNLYSYKEVVTWPKLSSLNDLLWNIFQSDKLKMWCAVKF